MLKLPEAESSPAPEAGDAAGGVVRLLLERGSLASGELERARQLAAEQGCAPWTMLLRLGLVAEDRLAAVFCEALGLERIDEEALPDVPLFEEVLSPHFLQEHLVLPAALADGRLHLAMADPTDEFSVAAVEAATGLPVVRRVALPSVLERALARLYRRASAEARAEEPDPRDVERLRDLASGAPAVRLVNRLLEEALEQRASDIHLEPVDGALRVRYRVDGVLVERDPVPPALAPAVVSRIKLLGDLDIAEQRLPQDGRFGLRLRGRHIDLRLSSIPTLPGESLVLRLLDREEVRLDLGALGFGGEALERVTAMLRRPHGMVLVTGPTGSGKSTTLHAALAGLNEPGRKIITVEDPVEYRLPGINQIQVNPAAGLTFSGALRAIVRQDPDIIMVGEMRDPETARIAVQSALTGHLVLSTLHTNDAASGITRLRDMGVEPYLVTATLNGIVAQRLVRRLCPRCATPGEAPAALAERLGADPRACRRLPRPRGCSHCNGIGYRGRIALTEVLPMDDPLRRLVMEEADADRLKRAARERGMRTLAEDGVDKALAGLTTLEEVARVAEV